MKNLLIYIVFFITMHTPVFAEQNKAETSLTEVQAIEIAKQYAIEHDIRPADWFGQDSSQATFDGKQWNVFFIPNAERGSATLGDMFYIFLTPEGEVILPSSEE